MTKNKPTADFKLNTLSVKLMSGAAVRLKCVAQPDGQGTVARCECVAGTSADIQTNSA